jgi:hypothetical protein
MKGWLNKLSPSVFKRWERRYATLSAAALSYFASELSTSIKNSVPTRDMIAVEVPTAWPRDKEAPRVFQVLLFNRAYTFLAESAAERDVWVSAFKSIVRCEEEAIADDLERCGLGKSGDLFVSESQGVARRRYYSLLKDQMLLFTSPTASRPVDSVKLRYDAVIETVNDKRDVVVIFSAAGRTTRLIFPSDADRSAFCAAFAQVTQISVFYLSFILLVVFLTESISSV